MTEANARQVGGTHYGPGAKIQHWDWVVANNLGYLEGVLTKYVCRHRVSGKSAQDRAKALHYGEKLLEARQAPAGTWRPFLDRQPIRLMPELVQAYQLDAAETEICRLAARYAGCVDLMELQEMLAELATGD